MPRAAAHASYIACDPVGERRVRPLRAALSRKSSYGSPAASPSSAQSSTCRRPASRPTSSVPPPPAGSGGSARAGPQARSPSGSRPRRRSRYSALARTSKRPSVSQNVGSAEGGESAGLLRGERVDGLRRRDASRRARTARDRSSPRPLRARAREAQWARRLFRGTAASSASGSTKVTSIRTPPGALTKRNWSPVGNGLLDDRGRERCKQVLLDRPPERSGTERRAEALVDQEGVRRLVELHGPRPLPEAPSRERRPRAPCRGASASRPARRAGTSRPGRSG